MGTVFESTRVADLTRQLDGLVDEFGYQGISNTERGIASVLVVLAQAIREEKVESLMRHVNAWEAAQAREQREGQVSSGSDPR